MPQIDGRQIRDSSIEGVDIKDGTIIFADFNHEITWKASVNDVQSLPASNNIIGDARVVNSSSAIYVWNGNQWITGSAGSIDWSNIVNKPTTFAPSTHNHDDSYFTESEINTNFYSKANIQTSGQSYVHWDNLTNKPATFAPSTHNHDDLYFTESEINTNFYSKTNMQTSGQSLVHWNNLTNKPATFAPSTHNHDANYQPIDGDLSSIAGLSGTYGFLKKTAANTWSIDTNSYTWETMSVAELNAGSVTLPRLVSAKNIRDALDDVYHVQTHVLTAGETIAVNNLIYIGLDSKAYVATKNNQLKVEVVGIATSAATINTNIIIQTYGLYSNAGLSLQPGESIFLGNDGDILQNLSLIQSQLGEVTVAIGTALTSSSIFLRLESPKLVDNNSIGIVESGSTVNGYYIKYIDGTMEQWGTTTHNATVARYYEVTKNLPVAFIDMNYSVSATLHLDVVQLSTINRCRPTSVSSFTYLESALDAVNLTTALKTVSWHAIGKWNLALNIQPSGTLAGIFVEESGSNSNGSYIKYSDGTLKCYRKISATFSVTKLASANLTFPATFIDTNISVTTTPYAYFHVDWYSCTGLTALSATNYTYFWIVAAAQNSTQFMGMTAIGRWK